MADKTVSEAPPAAYRASRVDELADCADGTYYTYGDLIGGIARITSRRPLDQANRQSPVFREIKALLIKTGGLGDFLRQHLQGKGESIQLAFLFGSYARGTDSPSSDIDLMVIGEITGREVARLLAPVRDSLQREINSVSMTPAEFRARARRGDPFLAGVLREPKIFIVGGKDELRKLVEPRKA